MANTRGRAVAAAGCAALALAACATTAPPDAARTQLPADLRLAHGGLSADARGLLLVGSGGGGGCFAPVLHDAVSGASAPAGPVPPGPGEACGVWTASASADGSALAVHLLDPGTVQLFRRGDDGRLLPDGTLRLPGTPGFPHPPPGRGLALSADGTALLAGAVERDCRRLASGAVRCGVAHLYRREGPAGWRLAATLPRPEGAGEAAHFGQSVLLLPDGAALIGGVGIAGGPGALHLFTPSGGGDGFALAQTLQPAPVRGNEDEFYATDLAASGDGSRVAVGASQAVALYRRQPDGGALAPAGRLTAPEERAGHFGESVALDGPGATLLVGAPRADCRAGPRCGIAYRYVRDGRAAASGPDRWRLAGTLGPEREIADANFGHEAALDATGAVSAVDGAGVTLEGRPAQAR